MGEGMGSTQMHRRDRFTELEGGEVYISEMQQEEDAMEQNSCELGYAYPYLMIGKRQIVQKRPYWGGNTLNSKTKGKCKYLVVF